MSVLFKTESGDSAITPSLRGALLIENRARIGQQEVMENFRPNITLPDLSSQV